MGAPEQISSDHRKTPSDVRRAAHGHYEGAEGQRYHDAKFAVPSETLPWVRRVRAAKFNRFVAPMDRVVEFGVGAGWNLAGLECRERTGIDIGAHLAPALRAQGIGFAEDSTVLADGSADALICHHVLEHVVSPADTLAELRRLLAPAGRLLMFVPYESEPRYRRYDPGEPNHHLFAWNAQTLGNLVADCGFEIVSADVVRYGYERAAAVAAHRLRLGEPGFRLLRGLAQLLRPAREVRIVARKPAAPDANGARR